MRSLRTRVFVIVALIVFAATAAAGLLSRRATLGEEQRMRVVTARARPTVALAHDADRAFAEGRWAQLEKTLRDRDEGSRFLVVDTAGRTVAASDDELASADVKDARADGTLTLQTRRGGTVARFELNGVPTFPVHDPSGGEAGRVFLLPEAQSPFVPRFGRPLLPLWVAATLGTAAIALVITFAVSRRVLRPVSALTDAARRMREGDLDVRVEPSGDDEIARLGVRSTTWRNGWRRTNGRSVSWSPMSRTSSVRP
jgi:methyl-accepting chemotaxis protein